MADNYLADNGSGADDDGEGAAATRRPVDRNENDDNGQRQRRSGV
jgi:hypothetical protein